MILIRLFGLCGSRTDGENSVTQNSEVPHKEFFWSPACLPEGTFKNEQVDASLSSDPQAFVFVVLSGPDGSVLFCWELISLKATCELLQNRGNARLCFQQLLKIRRPYHAAAQHRVVADSPAGESDVFGSSGPGRPGCSVVLPGRLCATGMRPEHHLCWRKPLAITSCTHLQICSLEIRVRVQLPPPQQVRQKSVTLRVT